MPEVKFVFPDIVQLVGAEAPAEPVKASVTADELVILTCPTTPPQTITTTIKLNTFTLHPFNNKRLTSATEERKEKIALVIDVLSAVFMCLGALVGLIRLLGQISRLNRRLNLREY